MPPCLYYVPVREKVSLGNREFLPDSRAHTASGAELAKPGENRASVKEMLASFYPNFDRKETPSCLWM